MPRHDNGLTTDVIALPSISENLAAVKARIACAAGSCGRGAGEVSLIAVSKAKPVAAITEAHQAGQEHFGENFVQEAVPKITRLAGSSITWHFIGTVQSNKTNLLARHFHWVHTVDRVKIARRLASRRAPETPLNVLLQVNIDADPAKAGVAPDAVPELLAGTRGLPGLRVRGLMTVLEKAGNPDLSFARMHDLFVSMMPPDHKNWDTLSMGMSRDMEAAIAHGATQVRIGSAIFGPRERPAPASARTDAS